MALPFILLTWIPGLSQRLPRPGQWMDTFKQFLAFPLYLTAVWLLWVAGRQTSIDVAAIVVIGLVLIAMAIWLWKLGSANQPKKLSPSKCLAMACLAAAIALPGLAMSTNDQPQRWEAYSPERLSQLRAEGKPVFINLTADWCITCLANERVALSSATFYQTLVAKDITYLKGDWTDSDPEITELLNQYQRSGVPLYLLFPKGEGKAQILPQILLETTVIELLTSIK